MTEYCAFECKHRPEKGFKIQTCLHIYIEKRMGKICIEKKNRRLNPCLYQLYRGINIDYSETSIASIRSINFDNNYIY